MIGRESGGSEVKSSIIYVVEVQVEVATEWEHGHVVWSDA